MKTLKLSVDTRTWLGFIGMLLGIVSLIRILLMSDYYLQIGGQEIVVKIGMYSGIFLILAGMFLSIPLLSKKYPNYLRMRVIGSSFTGIGLVTIVAVVKFFQANGFVPWERIVAWGAIILLLIGLSMIVISYLSKKTQVVTN